MFIRYTTPVDSIYMFPNYTGSNIEGTNPWQSKHENWLPEFSHGQFYREYYYILLLIIFSDHVKTEKYSNIFECSLIGGRQGP